MSNETDPPPLQNSQMSGFGNRDEDLNLPVIPPAESLLHWILTKASLSLLILRKMPSYHSRGYVDELEVHSDARELHLDVSVQNQGI